MRLFNNDLSHQPKQELQRQNANRIAGLRTAEKHRGIESSRRNNSVATLSTSCPSKLSEPNNGRRRAAIYCEEIGELGTRNIRRVQQHSTEIRVNDQTGSNDSTPVAANWPTFPISSPRRDRWQKRNSSDSMMPWRFYTTGEFHQFQSSVSTPGVNGGTRSVHPFHDRFAEVHGSIRAGTSIQLSGEPTVKVEGIPANLHPIHPQKALSGRTTDIAGHSR